MALARTPGTVTSADGTSIAFERAGDGPALILVGGALSTADAATRLVELLAEDFTAVAYDRRGRSKSGDAATYEVGRELDDLTALITEVGGTSYVFGHSSGAALALQGAAVGLEISKLAMYEPPFIVDDTRPPVPADYIERVEELVGAGRRGDAVAYFLTDAVGMPEAAVEQMRVSPAWPEMEAVAHTIAYDGHVMGDLTGGVALPPERWSSVTIPTLVMDGGASEPWARHTVEELARILPNARRRTLEGQAHGAAPEVIAPVLIEFFGPASR